MPSRININSISVTLAAATPTLLAAKSAERAFLAVQVTGTNSATIKFGSAPTSATDGFSLDPASAAGGQGGSFVFQDSVPIDAVYAISASGTTVAVLDGSESGH